MEVCSNCGTNAKDGRAYRQNAEDKTICTVCCGIADFEDDQYPYWLYMREYWNGCQEERRFKIRVGELSDKEKEAKGYKDYDDEGCPPEEP